MRTTEVRCDGCGADVTSTGNCVGYRLALNIEHQEVRGPYVTAMGVYL
ncbi:hypothetical protein ABIF74_004121 [Bradyrhizobium japonicum]